MKKIKNYLFTVLLICVSICFTSHSLADDGGSSGTFGDGKKAQKKSEGKICTYRIETEYTYRPTVENQHDLLASDDYVLFSNYILDLKGIFSGSGQQYADIMTNYLKNTVEVRLDRFMPEKKGTNYKMPVPGVLFPILIELNLEEKQAVEHLVVGHTDDLKLCYPDVMNYLRTNNWVKCLENNNTYNNSPSIKVQATLKDNSTCPSALILSLDDYKISDAIYSNKYADFEDDIANSSFDYNSLIAISIDDNNDKNYYDYYRGRTCSLQTRFSSNLNYGSQEGFDISAIIKKYQLENLNIKEVDEMLNSKGFDVDNALSIQQFSNRYGDIVKKFIIHDYLISDIEKDMEALNTFKEETADCIDAYYETKGNENQKKKTFDEWYETYDKDSNERYAKTLGGFLQLVINSYENISIDDKQVLTADDEINACGKDIFEECNSSDSTCSCQCAQIILNSNDLKYNDAKEYINNQCRGIQDTTAEERCKKGAAEGWCKKNSTSITCEEANNIENQFLTCQCSAILLNSNDSKYNDAKNYINNRCRGIQDTTAKEACRKGAAESYLLSHPSYCTKSDVSDVQDNAEKIINDIMERGLPIIYEYAGIDINGTTTEGLCTILYDKENGLGDYISGGLNLIRIVGPILVIVLTGLDAMKSIASQKEEEIRKFWDHIKIRLICLALLFLVPTIVNFLLELVIKEGLCQIK